MNQRTHTWIAIRAIALLCDKGKEPNLAKLLTPFAREASVGAWIPDQTDAKRGGAATENHVLKLLPFDGPLKSRFVTRKGELLDQIGEHRMAHKFLQADRSLDRSWWSTPYRGHVPKPGRHLANRCVAMSTMMKDLLLMGNPMIDQLIPGNIRFAESIPDNARTSEEAAAMYFFMLSHFLADACMPCHCDGRKLAGYSRGLHKQMEAHWSRKIGTGYEKKNLLPGSVKRSRKAKEADGKRVLEQARQIDHKFGLNFSQSTVPDLMPKHDVWLETIYICRASFAVASIIASPLSYPYDNLRARAPFTKVLGPANGQLMADIDRVTMHDAVLNTAIVWKHIWNKVSRE